MNLTATASEPSEFAQNRDIKEILHFTTNRGLLGIFHAGKVLCRDRLNADDTLASIRFPNCATRVKDSDWTGYVNLSISRVNNDMFDTSRNWHQHDDVWWAVLALDVGLLDDSDVYFATTNNTYPVVKRGLGAPGLSALFAERVPWGWHGSVRGRNGIPPSRTTCPQAEVLYPDAVPINLLRSIYVAEEEHIDQIAGWVANYSAVPPVKVIFKPDIFG